MLPPKANCGGTMTTSLYDISNMSDLSFGRLCVITHLYDAVAYPDYPPPGILHAGKGSAVTLATFGARAVWECMLGSWTHARPTRDPGEWQTGPLEEARPVGGLWKAMNSKESEGESMSGIARGGRGAATRPANGTPPDANEHLAVGLARRRAVYSPGVPPLRGATPLQLAH